MNGKLRNMTSLYIVHDNQFLMLYRIGSRIVSNSYIGTAGGHFECNELNDAKACVLRELREETGLGESSLKNLSMRYITMRLKDHEVRMNYYFFANLKDVHTPMNSNEGQLTWIPFTKVSTIEMPISAKRVVEHYIKEGQFNDTLYGGSTIKDDVVFSALEEF